MMIKTILLSTLVSTTVLASAAFAANAQLDGKLPMYPNGKLDARENSLTPDAIAHGVPLTLLTSDSVQTVEGWYAAHLPTSCTRQSANGGTKFACPGGSVMVYAHDGQTQVALIPPIAGMFGQ